MCNELLSRSVAGWAVLSGLRRDVLTFTSCEIIVPVAVDENSCDLASYLVEFRVQKQRILRSKKRGPDNMSLLLRASLSGTFFFWVGFWN